MLKSHVIVIDATKREVRLVEFSNQSEELRALVGGWIEAAHSWDNEDVLYVDEEGMFKAQGGFFRIADRSDQPLAGNGVIVGREMYDGEGEYDGTASPRHTVEEIAAKVIFLTREQFDSWGKANASEPAVTFYSWDRNGVMTEEVQERFGSLVGRMPKGDAGV